MIQSQYDGDERRAEADTLHFLDDVVTPRNNVIRLVRWAQPPMVTPPCTLASVCALCPPRTILCAHLVCLPPESEPCTSHRLYNASPKTQRTARTDALSTPPSQARRTYASGRRSNRTYCSIRLSSNIRSNGNLVSLQHLHHLVPVRWTPDARNNRPATLHLLFVVPFPVGIQLVEPVSLLLRDTTLLRLQLDE